MNADTLATGLSAFTPEAMAFAAGRLMLHRLRALANERRDFAFETTLASRSFAPWLKKLRATGYRCELVYLWLPHAELALQRVAERVRRGGHNVPEAVVRRRYDKSLGNFFDLYCHLADFWLMMDNSNPLEPDPIAWQYAKADVIARIDGPWHILRGRYERNTAT